jgi:hypothetical protein
MCVARESGVEKSGEERIHQHAMGMYFEKSLRLPHEKALLPPKNPNGRPLMCCFGRGWNYIICLRLSLSYLFYRDTYYIPSRKFATTCTCACVCPHPEKT